MAVPPPRDIYRVSAALIGCLAAKGLMNEDVARDFVHILQDCAWKPPEARHIVWMRLGEMLQTRFPKNDDLAKIFRDDVRYVAWFDRIPAEWKFLAAGDSPAVRDEIEKREKEWFAKVYMLLHQS